MNDILSIIAGILAAVVLPITVSTFKRTWRWAVELFSVVVTLVSCMPTVVSVLPVGVLWGLGFCWVAACIILWKAPKSQLPTR